MELNKFVTLWIFSLCLVDKSRTDRTSSSSPEIEVVGNGVSGEILIFFFFWSCESLLLYLVHPPVELSTGAPGLGRECLCHISDGAGTICSPAENSPAGFFPPKHRPPNSHPHI